MLRRSYIAEEIWLTHGHVAGSVNTETNAGHTLHCHLEVVDVGGLGDKVKHLVDVCILLNQLRGEVALQAARVVAQHLAARRTEGHRARSGQRDWSQVDSQVGEGPGRDTTTTRAGGQRERGQARHVNDDGALVSDELAIST